MQVFIRWRDDGSPNWSEERVLETSQDADTLSILRAYNLDIYRTRQYEISFQDDEKQFALISMGEEMEAHFG